MVITSRCSNRSLPNPFTKALMLMKHFHGEFPESRCWEYEAYEAVAKQFSGVRRCRNRCKPCLKGPRSQLSLRGHS